MMKNVLLVVVVFLGLASSLYAGDQITGKLELTCSCGTVIGTAKGTGGGQVVEYESKGDPEDSFNGFWDFSENLYGVPSPGVAELEIEYDPDSNTKGKFTITEPDGDVWSGTFTTL